MEQPEKRTAYYHLPGLFEFYELYRVFLPIFREHREYFYDWCEIGSVYGAPEDCIWDGGRAGFGDADPREVLALMQEYGISARLTLSNSLLREEHLSDKRCNALCELFEKRADVQNGVIVHSELLLDYLKRKYPGFYFVSSTTKVLTDFAQFLREVEREEFRYVVPDFRLNTAFGKWSKLCRLQKDKVEFLLYYMTKPEYHFLKAPTLHFRCKPLLQSLLPCLTACCLAFQFQLSFKCVIQLHYLRHLRPIFD